MEVGQRLAEESLVLEAHHYQWASRFLAGDHTLFLERADRGVDRYRAEAHHRRMFVYGGHDPGVCAADVGALALMADGHSEQGQARMARARGLARDLGPSSTLANCMSKSLMLASFRRDLDAIRTIGHQLLEYTEASGRSSLVRMPSPFSAGWHSSALAVRRATGSCLRAAVSVQRGVAAPAGGEDAVCASAQPPTWLLSSAPRSAVKEATTAVERLF